MNDNRENQPESDGRSIGRSVSAQVAHVCMVDRVAFTLQSIDVQAQMVEDLRQFVAALPAYQEAEREGTVVALDSGDGIALVFQMDPQLAGECAMALLDFSKRQRESALRIGLNSGLVTYRVDISGKRNVSGPGIDVAQRVMSSAQPNSVLMSRSMADNLLAFDAWRPLIREAGAFTVKHEQELFLYHLGEGAAPVGPVPSVAQPARGRPVDLPAADARALRPRRRGGPFMWLGMVALAGVAGMLFNRPSTANSSTLTPPLPPRVVSAAPHDELYDIPIGQIEFENDDVRQVVRALARTAKRRYQIDRDVEGKVSIAASNTTFGKALRTVLSGVDAAYTLRDGNIVIRRNPTVLSPEGFRAKNVAVIEERDADVREVVQRLLDSAHVNFAMPGDMKGRVSLTARNISLHDALERVLNQINASYVIEDEMVKIVPRRDPDAADQPGE